MIRIYGMPVITGRFYVGWFLVCLYSLAITIAIAIAIVVLEKMVGYRST